mmetsp:Transcript_27856/g.86451  ORF Transcript_27856/g.86451 Transcript_27856/m.86451 type:complete len:201 (-) Transcript_27856:1217-1819(-)
MTTLVRIFADRSASKRFTTRKRRSVLFFSDRRGAMASMAIKVSKRASSFASPKPSNNASKSLRLMNSSARRGANASTRFRASNRTAASLITRIVPSAFTMPATTLASAAAAYLAGPSICGASAPRGPSIATICTSSGKAQPTAARHWSKAFWSRNAISNVASSLGRSLWTHAPRNNASSSAPRHAVPSARLRSVAACSRL